MEMEIDAATSTVEEFKQKTMKVFDESRKFAESLDDPSVLILTFNNRGVCHQGFNTQGVPELVFYLQMFLSQYMASLGVQRGKSPQAEKNGKGTV